MTRLNDRLDTALPPDPATGDGQLTLGPTLTTATAGTLPERLAAHLRRLLDEPPADRSRQLAGLVAAAVEWGLADEEILALAGHHRPTRDRQATKHTDVAADVTRLLGKLRPAHSHVGRPCDQAGCPNAPAWMHRPYAQAGSGHDDGTARRSSITDPVPAAAVPRPPTAEPASPAWPRSVGDLLRLLASYVHLHDPGHVWFALAVAVSASLDGDPLWGMLLGPSASGKTEAIRILDRLAESVDELTAPALLSWTHGKQPRPTGVLTRVGERALVTVGDFSTVLATSDRGGRDQLFALLRRVYDGAVTRDLGNAPVPLRWAGRLTVLAACTPAIDNYQSHADQLGPRWLYYRLRPATGQGKRASSRKARHRSSQVPTLRRDAAELAATIVTAARHRAAQLEVADEVAQQLDELAVVCCYGRAVVPRNAYGRREIEGLALVEEPPRLVGQLLLLARGLLALGLHPAAVVALCRRAALDSMPEVRRHLLEALADGGELTVSAAARRVGCHRHVARMALEELGAIGLAACPALDDEPEDGEGGPWTAHPWRLAGPEAALVRAVVQAPAWHEVWGSSPDGGEGEGAGRGGGVGGSHTSCHTPPATSPQPQAAASVGGGLVCPACGQLHTSADGGMASHCPDCAVALIPVELEQPGGAA
jgi:hypothetical protein